LPGRQMSSVSAVLVTTSVPGKVPSPLNSIMN